MRLLKLQHGLTFIFSSETSFDAIDKTIKSFQKIGVIDSLFVFTKDFMIK